MGDPSYFPKPLSIDYALFRSEAIRHYRKSRSRRKTVFGLQFCTGGPPRHFYDRLLARFTVHSLAKFGRVLFADLRVRSLAIKYNAE